MLPSLCLPLSTEAINNYTVLSGASERVYKGESDDPERYNRVNGLQKLINKFDKKNKKLYGKSASECL